MQPVSLRGLVAAPSNDAAPGLPCLPSTQADISTAQIQPTQQNVTIPGHVVPNVRNGKASQKATMPDSANLHLELVFKLRNEAAFEKCLASLSDPKSPNYGHFLNTNTLRPYVPTPGQKQSVTAFLRKAGFDVTNGPSPIVLKLSGKVSAITHTFGTRLTLYQQGSSLFYSPDSDLKMPQSLGALVTGVTGLDNFSVTRPTETPCGVGSPDCPQGVQVGYGFSNLFSAAGTGQTVAIVDKPGDQDIQGAINTYTTQYGLLPANLQVVYPDGTPSLYAADWAAETAMDVEAVHTVAPGANIVVLYDNDLMSAIDYVANHALAQIVSNSWSYVCLSGPCGDTLLGSVLLDSVDVRLAVDSSLGLTILFASGDNGAKPDGLNFGTAFPASDPNVLAVGATNLILTGCLPTIPYTCSGYGSESGGSISGGGYSGYFAEPSWQTSTIGAKTGRAVPDVSMLGHNPGFWVYSTMASTCGGGSGGGWFGCSGTSLSTPLWAGLLADALQLRGGRKFGNIGPLLYQLAHSSAYSTDFHDITSGSNGYSATTGWDPVTGWGTPVAHKLVFDLTELLASTDKSTYAIGDSLQYTGVGLTTGGAVLLCLSTQNDVGNALCLPTTADNLGDVAGPMPIGDNVPPGPQKFFIQDVATGHVSNAVQLTILMPTTISLTLTPSSISLGSSLVLSGSIAPLINFYNPGTVQATISISSDSGSTWAMLMVIATDSSANYSASWTPSYCGQLLVEGQLERDQLLRGSTSSAVSATVTGTPPANPTLLLTASTTATQGQSLRLLITVFNPTGPPINANVTIQVTGPGNYVTFDVIQINVAGTSESTAYYDWTVPNQAGTYTVTVGLLPTKPLAFDMATIVVS